MKIDTHFHGKKLVVPLCMALSALPGIAGETGSEIRIESVAKVAPSSSVIHGTVLDSAGEPLVGATIRVDGTNTVVVADIDGNFAIKAKKGETLEVTYVGFKPHKVKAADGMTITLKEDDNLLDEVVVVAFGTQKKVTQTGAISSIKSEDLTRTPVSSVNNVLAGQLSGVSTVEYSGEPGENNTKIFIRGTATMNDDAPLIQVDGVEREMWNLDPNEIESITVLKDASATAVFGVRGANGVILVTTKRGIEGKAKIDVSLNFSAQAPTKIIDLANSLEYANFYNYTVKSDSPDAGNFFSDEVMAKFRSTNPSDRVRFPNMRWTDFVFKKTTFQQQHNINISGGNKRVRYFVSAGFFSQGGLFDQYGRDDMSFDFRANRFNYRSNLDINVTPTTTVSVNVGGTIDNTDKSHSGQGASGYMKAIYGSSPFSAAGFDDQGRFIETNVDPEYNMEYDADGNSHIVALPFTGGHPLGYYTDGSSVHTTRNTINTDLIFNQKLDVLTKNLSFRLKGSYNSFFHTQKYIGSPSDVVTPKIMPDGSIEYLVKSFGDPVTYTGDGDPSSSGRNWYIEAAFDWNREFGKHTLSALALYNQSKTYYPGGDNNDIGRGYVGFVGRVTYDYDNRYIGEVNFGYNGSENFAPKKRFGSFPAGSLGWVVSNEKFMQGLQPWLSLLKFRASLGLVGNDKIGGSRFMYLPDPYGVNDTGEWARDGNGYDFGTGEGSAFQPGAYQIKKNNPDVTWEKALKQNYAMELNFLNNRLKTSFDYYREHRTDILLINYASPTILGYPIPMTNHGIVDSWGWELSLGWSDVVNKDFSYWVRFNLSYNDNKIKQDGQAPQKYDYQTTAGHRLGSASQLKFWRFYDETAAADYEAEFGAPLPEQLKPNNKLNYGDPIYVDLNGDGKIDAYDYSLELGKTNDPRYIAGLMFGLTWKGLSFSAQFTGATDVSRRISGAFRQPFWNNQGNNQGGLLVTHLNDSWSDTNRDATYPRPTFAYQAHTYAESTLWEKDASYLRCKTLQLAYNFNMPWMKTLGINQLQLVFSAYNLFTLSKYKWGDPENRHGGSPDYPLTRTFTGGLKVGF